MSRWWHLVVAAILLQSTTALAETFGGILRPDEAGQWYVLEDQHHTAIGLDRVVTHDTHIELFFDRPFARLVTFTVQPDDTLTLLRVQAGASVGLGRMGIILVGPDGPINPKTITDPLANLNVRVDGLID